MGVVADRKKRVLVVEDNKDLSYMIKEGLGGKVLVMQAFTIEEAEAAFERDPGMDAIVMDACVPGDTPTTLLLVRNMRETFKGPMIAISSVPEYRQQLLRAGCDHESDKVKVAKMVLELVGVS